MDSAASIFSVFTGFCILVVFFQFFEKIRPAEPLEKSFNSEFKTEIWYPLLALPFEARVISVATTYLTATLLTPYLPYRAFEGTLSQLPYMGELLLAVVVMDLIIYARHRFEHSFLWGLHGIHHSAKHISWLTTYRSHPISMLYQPLVKTMILFMIGFSESALIHAALVVAFFNYLCHSNIRLDYGWPLRYILASPHFHRWHHAKDRKAINKNFSVVFSCIDLLFGTFYCPKESPVSYGNFHQNSLPDVPEKISGQILHPFVYYSKKLREYRLRERTNQSQS